LIFDAIKETLERTTLGLLEKGSNVNIERSLKIKSIKALKFHLSQKP